MNHHNVFKELLKSFVPKSLAPKSLFSVLLVVIFAASSFLATGCDMGTYSKRLKERDNGAAKTAVPEPEAQLEADDE